MPVAVSDASRPTAARSGRPVLLRDRSAVAELPARVRLQVDGLTASFGGRAAVKRVSLALRDHRVTAIIGPSGCGKSTFLRCLNRMHETVGGATVEGRITLDGEDIYAASVNPTEVRKKIGMVFQKPTPFPTLTIRDNVAAGLKVVKDGGASRGGADQIVERAMRRAVIWDELKDRLSASPMGLSGGQQQRLCIARALATEPEVLLLDEPTASLDPVSTLKVEELVHELRRDMSVIIVTHNMQQAARVSDETAFFLQGEMIEITPTEQLFTMPTDPRTESYITGRFG